VLGVMLGYSGIPEVFRAGIPALADQKFDFTDYSFNDICGSTLDRALALVEQNGGKVTNRDVYIPLQKPKAPKLEQWNPGIPYARFGTAEPAWSWKGDWTQDDESRVSRAAGDEVVLRFNGVAVAVVGDLTQDGGRAEVYLDGKRAGVADGYIVERTHDNALWHVYGLKSGEHTLRMVTTGTADPRSQGTRVAIERAIVYRKP
jgi:hypothetical protein